MLKYSAVSSKNVTMRTWNKRVFHPEQVDLSLLFSQPATMRMTTMQTSSRCMYKEYVCQSSSSNNSHRVAILLNSLAHNSKTLIQTSLADNLHV